MAVVEAAVHLPLVDMEELLGLPLCLQMSRQALVLQPRRMMWIVTSADTAAQGIHLQSLIPEHSMDEVAGIPTPVSQLSLCLPHLSIYLSYCCSRVKRFSIAHSQIAHPCPQVKVARQGPCVQGQVKG